MRLLTILAIVVGAVGLAGAQPKADLPSLLGKSRAALAGVFPGTSNEVQGWRGWKLVQLEFNAKGRLAAITLTPDTALSEDEAKKALSERLGVAVQPAAYVAAPAVHAWRNMKGPIRTVNLTKADGPGYRVQAIAIFFNIGYNE